MLSTEYGIWNMEYGRPTHRTLSTEALAEQMICLYRLGVERIFKLNSKTERRGEPLLGEYPSTNCVQACAHTEVQAVTVSTHKPQLSEHQIYTLKSNPHYPQSRHLVMHCLLPYLSTAGFLIITDVEVSLPTVST